MQKENEIKDLECHPKIPLIVNDKKIGTYVADFRYYDKAFKKTIIEDVKSVATKTPVYNLKKKILATYTPPIEIVEIFKYIIKKNGKLIRFQMGFTKRGKLYVRPNLSSWNCDYSI